ncbi:hypothetical protein D3C81_1505630 [compost metagenome]
MPLLSLQVFPFDILKGVLTHLKAMQGSLQIRQTQTGMLDLFIETLLNQIDDLLVDLLHVVLQFALDRIQITAITIYLLHYIAQAVTDLLNPHTFFSDSMDLRFQSFLMFT